MFMKIFHLAIIFFCFAIYSSGQTASSFRNPIAEKAIVSNNIQTENTVEINKARKVTVSVVFKNTYCGGAAPSQTILEQYKAEYPLKNSTILLQDTSGNGKTIKIRTNSKGYFKIKLRPGTYNFFMTKKYDKTLVFDFNPSCDVWLNRSFGQITIIEGQTDGYKILFDYGCNPCAPKRP
jgi:hypothetical protein